MSFGLLDANLGGQHQASSLHFKNRRKPKSALGKEEPQGHRVRKLFIAGHKGLVGSALVNEFSKDPAYEVISASRSEVDLTSKDQVKAFFQQHRPDGAILAAAKVGGIKANSENPVGFLTVNLEIQNNFFSAAMAADTKRLIFLGSSCIYPKFAINPIKEESLLTGALEETNEAYAIAKISGVKTIQAYSRQFGMNWTSIMPTNVYGERDNFVDDDSHVMPALIRRILLAKKDRQEQVVVWGTGKPMREFVHADDLAKAIKIVLENYHEPGPINVGGTEEVSIKTLSEMIAEAVGYNGKLLFDLTKPDGTPRKALDSSRVLGLGWSPRIDLKTGIASVVTHAQLDLLP
jgi:GDP-L-fucose synthase